MTDDLPPPVTALSSSPLPNGDGIVLTMIVRGQKVRCLLGKSQVTWAAKLFTEAQLTLNDAA
jgi:hypothetical protein